MSFITFLFLVSVGLFISVATGILLQLSWYERKSRPLSNNFRQREIAMHDTYDDVPPLHGDLFW
jgi:hypothetical protein